LSNGLLYIPVFDILLLGGPFVQHLPIAENPGILEKKEGLLAAGLLSASFALITFSISLRSVS